MIKVQPAVPTVGTAWDHRGKTDILQIFISWSNHWIDSIHFAYVEDEGNKVVLSDKIDGEKDSTYMKTVSTQTMTFFTRYYFSFYDKCC